MIKLSKKQEYALYAVVGFLIIGAFIENQRIQADNPIYFAKPLSADDLKQYASIDQNAVVVYPILTQNAYQPNGFYPKEKNGTYPQFTIVSMSMGINASYVSSLNSFKILQELHYPIITDLDVDQHPDILNSYDKIILLHNEYMTQNEFNAIQNHKNVIYLYPNAAYALVSVDYSKWQMTLIRGHGYQGVQNGFGFVTSSRNEYNLNCQNWKWEKMPNGMIMNCWPEFLIMEDRTLLQEINQYPNVVPPLDPLVNYTTTVNPSTLPNCSFYGYCGPLVGHGMLNSTENNES